MCILTNKKTKVICQGNPGAFHTQQTFISKPSNRLYQK